MKLLEIFNLGDNIQLDKKTLVILRWIAIVGQFITINFVYFILNFNFPFLYCFVIIFSGVLTNIFLQFKVKENLLSNFSSTLYLAYDLIQLAALVFLTGGITNPFIILLAIPAVVSSTFLSLKSTINLSFITVVSLLLLTLYHFPLPSSGDLHFHAPTYYLYGVPIAIIIGLIFLCYFGARFGLETRKTPQQLQPLTLWGPLTFGDRQMCILVLTSARQTLRRSVSVAGEAVEVTAGPMSQLFGKVNEVKTFQLFVSSPRVFWTESTRSLVPKVVDSNCGAENVPVFEIYFCSCFCTLVRLDSSDKAGLEY